MISSLWSRLAVQQHPALALLGRRLGRVPQVVEEHRPVRGRQLRRGGDRAAPGSG
ncbi:hypothetical protein [Streptomyces sp. SUK 48]|uniref:hypothetical protein n=1 Tax=Streptomyces sp. SUK 48 TaxID=2582831 RepID=UPI00129B8300|nr:hypothetical protein [Streptomyces sp. SUK 48]